MADQDLRMPTDAAIANLFRKRLREFTPQCVIATAACFVAPLEFGSPLWKSLTIAAVIAYCLFVNFGRGLILRGAFILLVTTLVEFSGAMPSIATWPARFVTGMAHAAN
jgi:hypothetical protein